MPEMTGGRRGSGQHTIRTYPAVLAARYGSDSVHTCPACGESVLFAAIHPLCRPDPGPLGAAELMVVLDLLEDQLGAVPIAVIESEQDR